ncbi:hypothetical protein BOTBODRAFT_91080, partial [Botryobasidium botryosum FD-172 SS1]
PCGFCGRAGAHCEVFLTRSSTGARTVKSPSCPFAYNFRYKAAAKFTKASPCTNVPIDCSLCPPNAVTG